MLYKISTVSLVAILTFSYSNLLGQEADHALSYDGVNEYTTLGNPSTLQLSNYTITLWFYSEDNTRSIITRGTAQGSNLSRTFDLYGDGTDLILFINNNGSTGHMHLVGYYKENQWNHIAITKKDSTFTTLLNDENPVVSTAPFMPDVTTYPWDIAGNGSQTFHGKLDELRIWDYARDLNLLQDKTHSVYTYWSGLVGAYKFNETSGTILPDTDAPAEDGTNINMDNSNWVTSYAPLGNATSRGRMNQRGLSQFTGTDDALHSDGFSLSVDIPLTETNYATYGHDNLARLNRISTIDLPANVIERYHQEWYIYEYGSVTADITFDLSKVWGKPIIAGSPSGYQLLYRSGTSGVFTLLASAITVSSSTDITFHQIDLQDGYYTLGTSDTLNSPIRMDLVSGQSYFGSNNYIEYIPGNLPILVVAPHGGSLTPSNLPVVLDRGRDGGSLAATLMLTDSMMEYTGGCRPHVIINHIEPKHFVGTGDMFGSAGLHPNAQQAWLDFNNFIEIAKTKVTKDWGSGHYFEMHTTARARNQIGLGLSANTLSNSDSIIATKMNSSTVKNLCTVGGQDFLEVIKGQDCFGSLLQAKGWDSSPSFDDPNPANPFFYAGKNTWRHGSNNVGTIDATHIESHYGYINNSTNRPHYSADLATSMITFMETFYGFIFDCSTTSTQKVEVTNLINVFPNPCHKDSKIHFSNTDKIRNMRLINLSGMEVDSPRLIDGFFPQTITSGVYFIIIQLEAGQLETHKLIILD